MPINNVDTVSTHKDTHIVATNKGNNSVDTVSTPDYTQLDEATLLGHYRQLNSNIKSWQTRQTDTARQNIANAQQLQAAITAELGQRGKTIKIVPGKGYQVVLAMLMVLIGLLSSTNTNAQARTVNVREYQVTYNQQAANATTGYKFRLDIDKQGRNIALAKDAKTAIDFIQNDCDCQLSNLRKAIIYYISAEPIPDNLKNQQ